MRWFEIIRVWWPWLSGRSLSPLIKGVYPEDHRSNDEVSGDKQSGEYQDPDMALIDNVKNHTHIGN